MLNITKEHITFFYKTELLNEIDVHFARFITGFSGMEDPEVFLGAALVSNATGKGNVCIDLSSMAGKELIEKQDGFGQLACPRLSDWQKKLSASPAVGKPGDIRPLVLDEKSRLYLYRYWDYEKKLSDSIQKRIGENIPDINIPLLKNGLKRLFPESEKMEKTINRQKLAAVTAVLKRFCIVSGGPGTGKTTTIASILSLLLEQAGGKALKIFLSAPTGKAAARLGESIKSTKKKLNCPDSVKNAIPADTYTIHRMLKTVPKSPYFRYNTENVLPADIVAIDEASMVDLALMSKLAHAVPADARVILIGDKDQLASVEAGSVLGDMCDREKIHGYSKQFCKTVEDITGDALGASNNRSSSPGLQDCIVILKKNYRFPDKGGIGELRRAVKLGETAGVLHLLKDPDDTHIRWKEIQSPDDLLTVLSEKVVEYFSAYIKSEDPQKALEYFNRFRILCAVNKGPFGVNAVNRLTEKVMHREGLIQSEGPSSYPWYRGRPILITRNDYNLGLFNGDIGIVMPAARSDSNDLYAFFPASSSGLRRFLPHRLPEHETAYAMTIHKSQGSEFEHVLIILPDKDNPVLTRELIYTGITRARRSVSIWGRDRILHDAVTRKIERTSGLRDALWG